MKKFQNTLMATMIMGMLLLFAAQFLYGDGMHHLHSQLVDQCEMESFEDKDVEGNKYLSPGIIDAILSIVFTSNLKLEFYDVRAFSLNNPPIPIKISRTILFRTLKIPLS